MIRLTWLLVVLAPGCGLVLDRGRHQGGDGGSALDAPTLDAPMLDASPPDTSVPSDADDAFDGAPDGALDGGPTDVPIDAPSDTPLDACLVARTMVVPLATGHVAFRPESGTREVNPAGTLVISSYFRTTVDNGELRRGIGELAIPPEAAAATSAVLRFRTTTAPSESHDVLTYPDANGLVTVADYDRTATPLGVITTEAVDYTFDVLSLVRARAGQPLGLRFQVAPPLDVTSAFLSFGIDVRDLRIEIEVPCGE